MHFKNLQVKRSFVWSLYLCLIFGGVQAQNFDWANSIGGLGLDVGRALTTDEEGNVIVVGSFTGGTHIADTFLTGYGSMESFVAKYTSNGELLWARVISGPKEDMARGVVTESNGNIFVVGHFTDTVVFDITETDTLAARSEGGQDVFVVKYSADGQLIWFRTGGGLEDDTATDIDHYPWTGRLYISGGFQKRAKFGVTALLSTGLTDAFLMKMDPDGNVHWLRNGGGLEHDIAASVAVDNHENIYIVGDFYDQANFDGTQLQALGSSDMFLVKYDADGTQQWARTNGGTTVDVATGVGTDLNDHVYVSGYFQGTTFFQGFSETAISYNDVFISRFDANGNCDWLNSAGSYGLDNCLGMAVAWDGTTYMTGMFEELMYADTLTTSGNGYDIFILCMSSSGTARYVRSAGAGSADIGMATCLSPDQSLYVTGYYYYYADFDQTTIGAADYGDCFLARMTNILGIAEDAPEATASCLYFDANSSQIHVNCEPNGQWQRYDLLGKMVDNGTFRQGRIEVPDRPAGVYLISVEGKEKIGSIKVWVR